MPYANEHSCQLLDPDTEHDRANSKDQIIEGKLARLILYWKGDKSSVQAMRFPKDTWSASAARAICRREGGRFEAAAETQALAEDGQSFFLSNVAQLEVRYEQADGKQIVRGLPLLKPGVWNGKAYTADDLRRFALNHAQAAEHDHFLPAIMPYHSDQAVDSRETQGILTSVYYDEQAGLLLGDAEVVDEAMIAHMQQGRFRYLSAEWTGNYHSPGLGKDLGKTLVGAAWVTYPAVRGMPQWDLVMNAQEFGEPAPRSKGGLKPMTLIERLKALVGSPPTEEEIESLAQEIAELQKPKEAANASTEPPKPAAELLKAKPEPPAGDDRDTVIAQLQAKVEADNAKHEADIAQLRQERHAEQVTMLVDTLVKGAYVPPAQRQQTLDLYMALPAEQMVETMVQTADGKGEQKGKLSMIALLTEVLKARGPRVNTTPEGLIHSQGDRVPGEINEAEAAKKRAEEIRAAHAADKKGG